MAISICKCTKHDSVSFMTKALILSHWRCCLVWFIWFFYSITEIGEKILLLNIWVNTTDNSTFFAYFEVFIDQVPRSDDIFQENFEINCHTLKTFGKVWPTKFHVSITSCWCVFGSFGNFWWDFVQRKLMSPIFNYFNKNLYEMCRKLKSDVGEGSNLVSSIALTLSPKSRTWNQINK